MSWQDEAKSLLGHWAAGQVSQDMVLGIGSGTTVTAFVEALGQRIRRTGLSLSAVAASDVSEEQARQAGIRVQRLEQVEQVDLSVDGADAVNRDRTLIKGGGAALVRERLVMGAATTRWILVDASKTTDVFHQVSVPVAVIPYGWTTTYQRLRAFTVDAALRMVDGEPVVTDDGLYLIDVVVDDLLDGDAWHQHIKGIDGVADTGIFAGYAPAVWVSDGTDLQPWPRPSE